MFSSRSFLVLAFHLGLWSTALKSLYGLKSYRRPSFGICVSQLSCIWIVTSFSAIFLIFFSFPLNFLGTLGLSYSVVYNSLQPLDCSPPGSFILEILQARVLEWVAISFSRVSSPPRDWTPVSCIRGGFFKIWATREAP